MKLRSLAIALLCAVPGALHAQGLVPSGTVYGNNTASQGVMKAVTMTSMLDRAFCSTNNAMIARVTGTWGCVTQPPFVINPAHGGTGIANNSANTLTWSGSFPATFTLTGSTNVTFPTTGTLGTAIGGVPFGNSITFSGVNSFANSWMWRSNPGSGVSGSTSVAADGYASPLHFIISPDTVTSTGPFDYMHVHANVAAGHVGSRGGITTDVNVVGTPASTPPAGTGFVGLRSIVHPAVNLLGTGGPNIADWTGNSFGGNSNVFSSSPATFMGVFTSWEFDTTLVAGSSAARKSGILIVKGSTDAVRGNFSDAAIQIADQDGAAVTGWQHGLLFGAYSSRWPFASDSTMIGAMTRTAGTPVSTDAKYGVDFSNVNFTTSGAPLRMPLITPATSGESCSAGSMKWDANYIYVCTAADTWKRAALSAF